MALSKASSFCIYIFSSQLQFELELVSSPSKDSMWSTLSPLPSFVLFGGSEEGGEKEFKRFLLVPMDVDVEEEVAAVVVSLVLGGVLSLLRRLWRAVAVAFLTSSWRASPKSSRLQKMRV